jgi:hypothetical protein
MWEEEADRVDGRTKSYKEHRSKLEARRIKAENKKKSMNEGSKEEYEKFFNSALKKFKIDSPADLKSDEEKKKFFNYVDKNYTGEKDEEFGTFIKEKMKEGLEDSPNKANSQHLCAKNVVHEEWGEGHPVHGMHAIPNSEGEIAWYDVMFEHGIEKGVSINELNVIKESMHNSHNKDHDEDDDDKKMLSAGKMSQMHQMIKDKKSAEEIAKAMKLDVKTVKALMSNYNMEEVELGEGYMELEFKDKTTAEKAYNYINNKIWAGGNPPYDDFNQEGNSLQIDTDANLNRRNQMLKDLEDLPRNMKFKVVVNEVRQLKDPENEIMVVKNGKVEVIDKKDKEKYMKKGYDLAEGKKYEHGIGKVNSAFEIGTPEYRQHTQSITPGQEITDYQRFKVESMKEALAKVWGLDEKLEEVEEKSLTKKVKGSTMTMTGKKSDEIDTKPEIDKEK